MDKWNQLYCQTMQTGVKLATALIPIRRPDVLFTIRSLEKIIQTEKLTNALIVTGPTISALGLLEPMKKILNSTHTAFTIYDQTTPNPTVQNAREAYRIYTQSHCDFIIGFGGGSNIDCAKAVGALVARPELAFHHMRGLFKIRKKLPVLVAIPTTAGSGSEVTPALMLSDTETLQKYPIEDYCLIPKYAILDPATNVTLPPSATAECGMDALTHAIEAYIGNAGTAGSRKDCLLSVKLIFENMDSAYQNGSDLTVRRNMLYASYYAGCAISSSLVGYIHAVAHSLGGEYHLPHGKINAIILPYVLETYGDKIHKKLHELAIAANVSAPDDSDREAAKKFIQAIKDMKKRLGIGDCIPEIIEKDIPRLAEEAAAEANPLYPVPIIMNAKELERYYYQFLPVELP